MSGHPGSPSADPLAALMGLPDVADGIAAARAAVDGVLAHRALRRSGGTLAAEVSLRCAHASAALSGSDRPVEDVRAGTVTDPVVQGALRVAGELPGLVATWRTTPRQVLARLHLLAARGAVPDEELGRPSASPLPPADAAGRLAGLCAAVEEGGTAAPGLLLAAVVHAELLAVRPFAGPNDVVARAAGRLTLMATGVDPRGLVAVDVGHRKREPEYRGASGAYATGTPDGVRSWLAHHAAAVRAGAEHTTTVADTI